MSELAHDASDADFEQEVIAKSHEVPVVVDFWAEWCAPCRFLGPVLEKEVSALGGRVRMAKVDVDRNPQVSAAYGIRSIPAVKAFRGGKLVAEFEGARDAGFLRQWLATVAPSPARSALEQALAQMGKGNEAQAATALEGLVDDGEVGADAALLLARLRLDGGHPETVPGLLAKVDPRSSQYAQVATLQRRLQFAHDAAAVGGEEKARTALQANPEDLEARYGLASALAARSLWQPALEEFLELVGRSRKFREDAARVAMLAIFEHLGPAHELTREYRRRLQAVL